MNFSRRFPSQNFFEDIGFRDENRKRRRRPQTNIFSGRTHVNGPATLVPWILELIDFSCSPRSSPNRSIFSRLDFLASRFTFAEMQPRRLLVIRLTRLSANNSPDFHFCHRVNRPGRKQFRCRCQEMEGKTFASYFRLLFPVRGREGKCVHSPSIHHAISRQKLSINHSGTSIK